MDLEMWELFKWVETVGRRVTYFETAEKYGRELVDRSIIEHRLSLYLSTRSGRLLLISSGLIGLFDTDEED